VKPSSVIAASSFADASSSPAAPSASAAEPRSTRSPAAKRHIAAKRRCDGKPVTHQQAVLQAVQAMHNDMKEAAAQRLQAQKTMHEQKMKLFGDFLTFLKGTEN